jgi:SAM-dependent methyltransferase
MKAPPDPIPHFPRFAWPKLAAPLSAEGQRISDDFMRHWHDELPKKYGVVERFNHAYPLRQLPKMRPFRTIELGAGLGSHVPYEDLSIQEYHCIELRENMTRELRRRYPNITATAADCQEHLPYPDAHFDRAVVIHVFEHLPNLPAAVAELRRVLKPGAIFSLVLPCDPGIAYGIASRISGERFFRKRFNMPYAWLKQREHINSPAEIFSVMKNGFQEMERSYFPLHVPIVTMNLCIGVTYCL